MAFGSAGGPGLVAPSGCLSVCATRFRPWVWPAVRRFVPVRRGSSRARRKPVLSLSKGRGVPSSRPASVRKSGGCARVGFLARSGGLNSAGWFWRAKNPFAPRDFGLGPGPQKERGQERTKERGQVLHLRIRARPTGQAPLIVCRLRVWHRLSLLRRMAKRAKSKSHAAPASFLCSEAQPGAQGDAGCAFGFVDGIFRRAP
jgi:hypothetical protein